MKLTTQMRAGLDEILIEAGSTSLIWLPTLELNYRFKPLLYTEHKMYSYYHPQQISFTSYS